MTLYAVLVGFITDLIIGDPHWMYHPVRLIGKLITFLEDMLRKTFPKTKSCPFTHGVGDYHSHPNRPFLYYIYVRTAAHPPLSRPPHGWIWHSKIKAAKYSQNNVPYAFKIRRKGRFILFHSFIIFYLLSLFSAFFDSRERCCFCFNCNVWDNCIS